MRLFWNTLRLNKKTGYWFSRGSYATLSITTRCPFKCSYCPVVMFGVKVYDECSLAEWKSFIENYPEWMSYIAICGGEPSLVDWLPEFVNWLVDRGHHVLIYSNLWRPEVLAGINPSFRVRISATLHYTDQKERFLNAYNQLKDKYTIDVLELGDRQLSFSKKKQMFSREDIVKFTSLHCDPTSPRTRILYAGAENCYAKQ